MTTYIALLRAVNLAGRNRVAMADLRKLLDGLGMREVRSLLQSGNLVFGSDLRSPAKLEAMLEGAVAKRLGLETDFLVRTAEEWSAVIDGNPFAEEARRDPGHLLVVFLKQAPKPGNVTALRKATPGREEVRATGRHAYIVYPDGVGRSRLTSALIERTLGTRGTARNWNTVGKLGALVAAPSKP
jgi:uncharacterized protein (DUF1697 family)